MSTQTQTISNIHGNTMEVYEDTLNTLVAFHTSRGGRFYNGGHKTFIGQDKPINDFTSDLFEEFENYKEVANAIGERENLANLLQLAYEDNQQAIDRLASLGLNLGKKIYVTCGRHEVGLEVDNDGTGYIDIDGDYDTTHVCRLEDCSDDEVEIIINQCGSNDYNKNAVYNGYADKYVVEYCAFILGNKKDAKIKLNELNN